MPIKYCSLEDVKNVAKPMSSSFATPNQALDDRINEVIDEVSEIINEILKSRYVIATIEATIPSAVKNYCKVLSAKIIITQETLISTTNEAINGFMKRLRKRVEFYKKLIMFGDILDSSNNVIDAEDLLTGSVPKGPSDIEELYEDGIRFVS